MRGTGGGRRSLRPAPGPDGLHRRRGCLVRSGPPSLSAERRPPMTSSQCLCGHRVGLLFEKKNYKLQKIVFPQKIFH